MSTTIEASNGVISILKMESQPIFSVRKNIPTDMGSLLEGAIDDFIEMSHVPQGIDRAGFKNQTMAAMAGASVLGQGGELWLGTKGNDELLIYVLAHIGNDLDGRLAYTVSQCWVRKDYRGNPIVKEWWDAILQRAKDCLCKHVVIVSSRNPKAYIRWLGGGLHYYATLLKLEV